MAPVIDLAYVAKVRGLLRNKHNSGYTSHRILPVVLDIQ